MELIDRNKLIKQLNLLEKFNNEDVPKWVWDIIKSAQVLEKRPDNEWISCKDVLPDYGAEVWVTIQGLDFIIPEEGESLEDAFKRINQIRWVDQAFLSEDGWNTLEGYPLIVRPIAWMMIEKPAPYKEEK